MKEELESEGETDSERRERREGGRKRRRHVKYFHCLMSFYIVDVPPGEGRRGRNHIHNVCTCTCTCTVSCKKTTSVYTHLLILKNNSVRAPPLSTMGLGADRSCSKCIPSPTPNVWLGFWHLHDSLRHDQYPG